MKSIKIIFLGVIICFSAVGCAGSGNAYYQPYYMAPTPADIGSPPIFRPGYAGPFF